MERLLDEAPCGFISFADDGIITAVNRTLLEIVGYARDDLAGASIERILTVGTRIFYQTHFFPLIRMHGRADEIFLILRCADGTDIGVLANAIRRERDGAFSIDCVLIPVRERQKFEAELVRARRTAEEASAEARENQEKLAAANRKLERLREEADQANLAKSNFLAMMSHELRTPLNAISGYAQLLEMGVQGAVTDVQKESLQRIQQSQRHLLRLVNEILNLARIESGHVEYDLQDVEAGDIVSRIIPLIEPQMQQKGIGLHTDIPAPLPVHCDIDKTQQILLNLISNAIKFTPTGGTISISAAATGDGSVVVEVRDTGIGIPADMIETIFDPFVQVEMSRSRRGEGTGLGLAISRDLATGMGGMLTASSVSGEGSVFYLTLPSGIDVARVTPPTP